MPMLLLFAYTIIRIFIALCIIYIYMFVLIYCTVAKEIHHFWPFYLFIYYQY